MHSKFIRLALFPCSLLLLVHSTIAQIIPVPATPPPIIDPGTIITPPPTPTIPPTPGPTAMPDLPPTPPPTPSVSPKPTPPSVSPSPITTPTVSPIPTAPPVTPPPTPTIPPASPPPIGTSLGRPDPQRATAMIRWGQGNTLVPKNDQGRFQKVALQPAQEVTVVMTVGLADFGKPADVQILDGGAIASDLPPTPTPYPTPPINDPPTGPSPGPSPSPPPTISPTPPRDLDDLIDTGRILTVSQAGELIFRFKPGADIGLHRVSVIVGGTQYFLQFWRQNPSAPNNNPGMLRAY